MALNEHRTSIRSIAGRLFGSRSAGPVRQTLRAYHCTGCGEALTFDALSATCRCSDECYHADEPRPDAVGARVQH